MVEVAGHSGEAAVAHFLVVEVEEHFQKEAAAEGCQQIAAEAH